MSYKSLVRVTTAQSDLCSYLAKKQVTVAALPEVYTLREYKRDLENTITDERVNVYDLSIPFYQNSALQVDRSLNSNIKMTAMTIIAPTTLDDLPGIDLIEFPVKDLR